MRRRPYPPDELAALRARRKAEAWAKHCEERDAWMAKVYDALVHGHRIVFVVDEGKPIELPARPPRVDWDWD